MPLGVSPPMRERRLAAGALASTSVLPERAPRSGGEGVTHPSEIVNLVQHSVLMMAVSAC